MLARRGHEVKNGDFVFKMIELSMFKCFCDGASREGAVENEGEKKYNQHKVPAKAEGNGPDPR